MHEPNYDGQGIANLMSSIESALGPRNANPQSFDERLPLCSAFDVSQLQQARHVVLLVIDGLGHAQLKHHAGQGALMQARVSSLSSVFPSTTASAVTTFMTGQAPIRHGLTGWHMWFKELGVVGAPLPFHIRGSNVGLERLGRSAQELLQLNPLSSRLARRSVIIQPAYLCDSAFSDALRGEAQSQPITDFTELTARITALAVQTEPSYCYAYWPTLDSLSHIHGSMSEQAGEHLRQLDEHIADCVQQLRGSGTVLLVCADHGFIDTRAETRLRLADYPDIAQTLCLPLCGEPRTVYCYVRAGQEANFERAVEEQLGHAARVIRSQQALENGWFGHGPQNEQLQSRIGTHILLMQDEYCLTDQLVSENRVFSLIGVHGGLSDAELAVPLCVFSC